MEIKLNRHFLFNKLQTVIGLTESESPNEILQNILLRSSSKKKQCFIAATDIESTIVSYFKPEDTPGVDFDILVPARKFLEIMRYIEDNEVVIRIHKNGWMEMTTDSGVFKFPCLSGKDFPKIPVASTDPVFSLSSSTVLNILPLVLNFVASDSLRRNLNGVLFEKIDGKTRLVATDSHRLAYFQKQTSDAAEFEKFILSKKALSEVTKTVKSSEPDSEVSFSFDRGMVFCSAGDTVIISNPIDSPFPDYRRVVPDFSASRPAVIDKGAMLNAVRRVGIFSERLDLSLAPSGLSISSGETSGGEAVENVSVNFGGDEAKTSFNSKFLVDSLNFLDGDQVEFRSGDGSTPGVLTLASSEDFVCILMPVVTS